VTLRVMLPLEALGFQPAVSSRLMSTGASSLNEAGALDAVGPWM
jgi:hypothetical protein